VTTDANFDPLLVALRVYAVPDDDEKGDRKASPRRRPTKWKEPQRTLVIDTETTTDPFQQLNFGVWRYYVDRRNGLPGRFCVQEGIFYADDLPERDPEGYAVLQAYAESHDADVAPGRDTSLRLLSRSEFVEKVLWRYAYRNRATVVGFNLSFDLSRLAIASAPARSRFAGGISLKLFHTERYRPRIAYKTIDSKRTLIGFTTPYGVEEGFRGHFLDLRTLTFSLTDRGYTLESACSAFGVPYSKRLVTHGVVTDKYVTYCREDVGATSRLLTAAIAEYRRHPIDLQETKAFSPASIGKSYLRSMGIRPILERQPEFDRKVLGGGMAASFGGRAECRIRKVPLPIVYVDFLSMYTTVNALMRSWRLVIARQIAVDNVTARVRKLLAASDLFEQCFAKSFWPKLLCLVEIEPGGDLLPVRAAYDPASTDFGIGVNPYRFGGTAWYALADLVDSVVSTGLVPKVRRAVALRPVGHQGGLTPVQVRGAMEVDPSEGDFFRQVIELRKGLDTDPSVAEGERERLSRFLKIFGSATSYGILAEYVRHERHDPVAVTVHGDGDQPFAVKTMTPEEPGPFCFPPLAAVITAEARLMVGLLERCVRDAGGGYVFCDTDSMGIVADPSGGLYACPGGPENLKNGREAVRALSWAQVDKILDRFAALNPYDRSVVPGSILKVEKENFDDQGARRQLWCWAISAKRYVLYTPSADGPVLQRVADSHEEAGHDDGLVMAKVSEHGLGHLLNPTDPNDPSGDWITEAWTYLVRQALGLRAPRPKWLNRPALTRVTASSPTVLRWFAGLNGGKPYAEQIKPANFLLLAHPDPLDPSGALPIAPYESDPSRWDDLPWIDRRNGQRVRTTTEPSDGNERPGVVRVRTYGQVLADYLAHPEAKSLEPNGGPVGRHTVGLLRRRPVEALRPVKHIGKEGNRLDDRLSGLVSSPDEYRTEYIDPSRTFWTEQVAPVLRTMDRTSVARTAGVHRRTLERWLYKGVRPRASHERLLTKLAREHTAVRASKSAVYRVTRSLSRATRSR